MPKSPDEGHIPARIGYISIPKKPDTRFSMLDDNNPAQLQHIPAWHEMMGRIDLFLAEPA